MNEPEEALYLQGQRAGWRKMLDMCLRELGYDHVVAEHLVREREETIAALREVCGDFGDNDWQESLHLADVIQKHLAKHLHDRESH